MNAEDQRATTIDYVVVSFLGDLPLLALQARGFATFHDAASLGRILVINNDARPAEFARRFEAVVRPLYGAFADRVDLLPAETVLPEAMTAQRGWRRQQALKLAAWRLVTSDVYVVLDSKNHLIRPCGRASYVTPEGRLVLARRRLWPVARTALEWMGVAEAAMPPVVANIMTPYPLLKREVAALSAEIERRGEVLATLFEQHARLYEFTLYYAWLVQQGRQHQYDLDAPFLVVGYWPHGSGRPEEALHRVIAFARLPHVRWLGIHRKVAESPPTHRGMIAELWRGTGLLASVEEGEAILAGRLPGEAGEPTRDDDEAEDPPGLATADPDGEGDTRTKTIVSTEADPEAPQPAAPTAKAPVAPLPPPLDPVDELLLPGFNTGAESLGILKVFAGLCGPRVLDIGAYRGGSTLVLSMLGKTVEGITDGPFWPRRLAPVLDPYGATVRTLSFEDYEPAAKLDGIWAFYILQNQRNAGLFLDRCRDMLADDGWLAVVVPPIRTRITAGKVSAGWNLGALMYALLAAGFDLTRGHFITHGFNVAALVPRAATVPARHADAFADPAQWPFAFDRRRGFDGDIAACRWPPEFRERMATGLSELAPAGPHVALEEARKLASVWV